MTAERSGSRLGDEIDEARTAVYPDPLSRRLIRLRDASATIVDYKRSTGDVAGVVDLLLTFVEAGTAQAADLGYGDDTYFVTLERKLTEAVSLLEGLPEPARAESVARIIRLGAYQAKIGWGYGDVLADIAARLPRRTTRSVRARGQHAV